jgi:prolyl oligopeptidase
MSGSENWVQEFGDPDTKDWDKFLKNYSPYHNINEGVKKYPPILFTTCSRDQRAHPGHTRKMVKKLWDLGRGKRWPAYFYETLEGGSDDAKQYAFTTALGYDFLYRTLSKNAGKAKRPENRII